MVQRIAAGESAEVVAICNKLESEIAELENEEKIEFLQDLGVEPGLDRVRAGYSLLGLPDLLHRRPEGSAGLTVRAGATAPKLPASFTPTSKKDLSVLRSSVMLTMSITAESQAQRTPVVATRRKDVVADGDVIHFRFNM